MFGHPVIWQEKFIYRRMKKFHFLWFFTTSFDQLRFWLAVLGSRFFPARYVFFQSVMGRKISQYVSWIQSNSLTPDWQKKHTNPGFLKCLLLLLLLVIFCWVTLACWGIVFFLLVVIYLLFETRLKLCVLKLEDSNCQSLFSWSLEQTAHPFLH